MNSKSNTSRGSATRVFHERAQNIAMTVVDVVLVEQAEVQGAQLINVVGDQHGVLDNAGREVEEELLEVTKHLERVLLVGLKEEGLALQLLEDGVQKEQEELVGLVAEHFLEVLGHVAFLIVVGDVEVAAQDLILRQDPFHTLTDDEPPGKEHWQ